MAGVYDCSLGLENCAVVVIDPIDVALTGIEADDFDFAFFHHDTRVLYLYGNDTLHVYRYFRSLGPTPADGGFVKVEQDLVTPFLNNTDAAFLYEPDPLKPATIMLLKGYDIYETDFATNMTYAGEVTAPCLEKDLEENELSETFIKQPR